MHTGCIESCRLSVVRDTAAARSMAAPSGAGPDAADDGIELRKCSQCGAMQTHMWREGPDGRRRYISIQHQDAYDWVP